MFSVIIFEYKIQLCVRQIPSTAFEENKIFYLSVML